MYYFQYSTLMKLIVGPAYENFLMFKDFKVSNAAATDADNACTARETFIFC